LLLSVSKSCDDEHGTADLPNTETGYGKLFDDFDPDNNEEIESRSCCLHIIFLPSFISFINPNIVVLLFLRI
jgi:hypothetical protein